MGTIVPFLALFLSSPDSCPSLPLLVDNIELSPTSPPSSRMFLPGTVPAKYLNVNYSNNHPRGCGFRGTAHPQELPDVQATVLSTWKYSSTLKVHNHSGLTEAHHHQVSLPSTLSAPFVLGLHLCRVLEGLDMVRAPPCRPYTKCSECAILAQS